jgi:hypothetical protein
MANSSNFAKGAQRQGEELWNVTLLPLAFGSVTKVVTLDAVENVDERRSSETFGHRLSVSRGRVSGILV